MPPPKTERRSTRRVPARVPVTFGSPQSARTTGFTRDLSLSGVFLYADAEILEGSQLDLVFMLPPQLSRRGKSWVCCQASVIRVEPGGKAGRFGVAARIETMAALPEIIG